MSDTHIHKGQGYWKSGKRDRKDPKIRKYLRHCRRFNREFAFFKDIELRLKKKIAEEEMKCAIEESEEEDIVD